ncbi:MAG TPA: DUF1553 domain-containing protein, partial [Planctomycetaceae bacterium]|nr:DUF1553 domain-containing protein [Planctomycetaceae bacterium]
VFGEQEPTKWMAGSNNFSRTKPFEGPEESDALNDPVHIAIVYQKDGTILGYRNGEPYGKPYKSSGLQKFEAKETQVLLGLRHGTSAGGNRLFQGSIDMAQLYDRALSPDEIAASAGRTDYVSRKTLLAKMSDTERKQIVEWETEVTSLSEKIARLQDSRVYAVVPKPPEPTHLLLRGNPSSPAEEVVPRGIASLADLSPDFGLASDSADPERRKQLADWITSPDNPLFARVIVNRMWHYHFGIGLVDSPNDFGFNGGRPTHPELLDFLASSLIEHGYSLKGLHRMIVTSQTYRQSSKPREECLAVDADNRLLWRFAPQRLEAEALRDTILKVSGQLNPQLGGPPFRDFETFNFNSQFYVMRDKAGPEFNRRTIYRMWIRSGRNGFLDAFDCPDPSTTAPKRAVTTTPTQSLSLLNNSFVLRMADKLAERISKDESDRSQQIVAVYRQALQRSPTDAEFSKLDPFVKEHGLAAFVRVLFNSNEFVFVE